MSATWPLFLAAATTGAVVARKRANRDTTDPVELDIWKSGEVMRLAADWLREGDIASARAALELVGEDTWRFARDEVIARSPQPRISAMHDRMSADALLTCPAGEYPSADRMLQVEALSTIAAAIRLRANPIR